MSDLVISIKNKTSKSCLECEHYKRSKALTPEHDGYYSKEHDGYYSKEHDGPYEHKGYAHGEDHIHEYGQKSEHYKRYIEKHGYHFTDELAEHASKAMKNVSSNPHSWTVQQAKKTMESLGLAIPSTSTHGDITYTANMAYADFYPDPIKDEASCLRYAYKVATDPDGYEGMAFCRWMADVYMKHKEIDWEKFV